MEEQQREVAVVSRNEAGPEAADGAREAMESGHRDQHYHYHYHQRLLCLSAYEVVAFNRCLYQVS